LVAIFSGDQLGYLPISEDGKFKNRVMYNLSKLEADAQGQVEVSVLETEIGQYYDDLKSPLYKRSDQESRFQMICLRYDRAYHARILWNRANNPSYSKDNLNHDLTIFSAAFPTSRLVDGLTAQKVAQKLAPGVPATKPKTTSQTAPATEAERTKELLVLSDFETFQAGLEKFQVDFPKSSELRKLEDRLLELNVEYLKANHR